MSISGVEVSVINASRLVATFLRGLNEFNLTGLAVYLMLPWEKGKKAEAQVRVGAGLFDTILCRC